MSTSSSSTYCPSRSNENIFTSPAFGLATDRQRLVWSNVGLAKNIFEFLNQIDRFRCKEFIDNVRYPFHDPTYDRHKLFILLKLQATRSPLLPS